MKDRTFNLVASTIFGAWMGTGIYNNWGDIGVFKSGIIIGVSLFLLALLCRLFFDFDETQLLKRNNSRENLKQRTQRLLWPIVRFWRWYLTAFIFWVAYIVMDALDWEWATAAVILGLLAVILALQATAEFVISAPFRFLFRYGWFRVVSTSILLLITIIVVLNSAGLLEL